MPLHTVYFYGALRVILSDATGEVIAVQDRVSGMAAAFRFSPDYITRAIRYAQDQWSACTDACV